jgi:ABC-type lipoprotein export system ATPase subunit
VSGFEPDLRFEPDAASPPGRWSGRGGSSRYRLSAAGLRLRLGGRDLLDGVDLDVAPGDVTAISGPSGSGKTSLLMVLAGVLPPDAGRVDLVPVGGVAPADRGGDHKGEAAVGYVPQSLGLVPHLTATENVAIPLQVRGLAPAVIRQRVEAALGSVGLAVVGDRIVTELSGGQRQRVAVARAIAGGPDVLVADEATTDLDPENRSIVLALFHGLAEGGCAVVLATHDPSVIEACPHTYLLEAGALTLAT